LLCDAPQARQGHPGRLISVFIDATEDFEHALA
jgi:hypothetical protein